MKNFKRMLLVRDTTRIDAIHIVLETDDGDVPLRIPVELLNNAITGLFAGAQLLAEQHARAPIEQAKAVIAAPFFVQDLGTHAEAPEHTVLTARCGPATLALHMRPQALAAALREMESAAASLAQTNQRPH